jgi:hypothetical protein
MTRLLGTFVTLFVLAAPLAISWPAFASAGCRAFNGQATDTTKGPGGQRAGAGFDKGDMLAVTISSAPGMMKESVDLLQYSSPDGPFQAVTPWAADSFTYMVRADTGNYIYLNLGSVNKGVIVTWSCKSTRTD